MNKFLKILMKMVYGAGLLAIILAIIYLIQHTASIKVIIAVLLVGAILYALGELAMMLWEMIEESNLPYKLKKLFTRRKRKKRW